MAGRKEVENLRPGDTVSHLIGGRNEVVESIKLDDRKDFRGGPVRVTINGHPWYIEDIAIVKINGQNGQ